MLKSNMPLSKEPGDAGFDIKAYESKILPFCIPRKIKTNLHTEFSDPLCLKYFDRSSMAARGILTLGGVIDPSYRGEHKVILINLNILKPIQFIKAGQKITQALFLLLSTGRESAVVNTFSESKRGSKGFGSTGK